MLFLLATTDRHTHRHPVTLHIISRSIHGHARLSTGQSFALEYCGDDTHVFKVSQDWQRNPIFDLGYQQDNTSPPPFFH